MNTRYIAAIAVTAAALTLAACEQRENVPETPAPSAGQTTDADNTARNRRDTDPNAQTPFDQSESAEDIRITAEIRRAILGDDAMSTNADNVKIMTANGVVTIRGPVNTQAEKDAIEAKAKAIAGVVRIDNQLEVTGN